MIECIERGRASGRRPKTTRVINGVKVNMNMARSVFYNTHGYLPELVRHTCDNKFCINPDHLVAGTHADNMRDMTDRNRAAVGERQGRSTVSDADAQAIYDRFKAGAVRGRMAKEYGVSRFAIDYIINERKSVCRSCA